jgi:hypothetical protein
MYTKYIIMDADTAPKKRHQECDLPCKKTDSNAAAATAAAECETICREMLKCTHIAAKPAAQNTAPAKPKKERELLEGYTEYMIFWN